MGCLCALSLERDMDTPSESRREPALTVRRELRPVFAALFVLQTFGLVARRFYIALVENPDAALLDIAAVSLSQLERDGAKAVVSTVIMTEVWDAMMGTRDAINDWLKKRRDEARDEGVALGLAEGRVKGRAEGIAEGIVKGAAEGEARGEARGRAEVVAEVVAWNERRLTAEEKGEPFDEPPPGVEDGESE